VRARFVQTRTLAALLALALAGCVTPAGEQQVGDEEAKKVEQEMGLLREPALLAYVRAVGAKLVAVSERPQGPWQFEVVDRPEPNAFALPGGHVYVTRGLLVLLNSEDELACVLGHEIAHVTASHSTKRMGAAVATAPITIATGLAGFAVGIVSPVLGSAVAGTGEVITGGLVLAPFSREQEYEADELGQSLAARAGYDPLGLARFLHTLDRDLALQPGEKATFHFLDSHPLTPDREARSEERARELARALAQPIAGGRAAFLARLEGILVGEDPAQGVFEGSRFLQPELDLVVDFPAGWKTQNTDEAVGAISPAQDAVVALHVAAQNSSLDQVLAEMEKIRQASRAQSVSLALALNGLSQNVIDRRAKSRITTEFLGEEVKSGSATSRKSERDEGKQVRDRDTQGEQTVHAVLQVGITKCHGVVSKSGSVHEGGRLGFEIH
jgi:predicted Zn-dependent protease